MRVNCLAALVVLGVSLMAITMTGSTSSWAGLALSFAVQFTSLLQWTMRTGIEAESNMVRPVLTAITLLVQLA